MQPSHRDVPKTSDVAAIREMVSDTGFFRADEVDVAAELVEERLAKGIASGYHFSFAETNGLLAGYVCYGPTPCTVGSFDLYWIVVDKKWQGRGLGLELCRIAEAGVGKLGGRRLYVETSGKELYQATRAFYVKAGYTQIAVLPDFYDIGDDKVIYQKDVLPDHG